jgi:hypothetical protein
VSWFPWLLVAIAVNMAALLPMIFDHIRIDHWPTLMTSVGGITLGVVAWWAISRPFRWQQ